VAGAPSGTRSVSRRVSRRTRFRDRFLTMVKNQPANRSGLLHSSSRSSATMKASWTASSASWCPPVTDRLTAYAALMYRPTRAPKARLSPSRTLRTRSPSDALSVTPMKTPRPPVLLNLNPFVATEDFVKHVNVRPRRAPQRASCRTLDLSRPPSPTPTTREGGLRENLQWSFPQPQPGEPPPTDPPPGRR